MLYHLNDGLVRRQFSQPDIKSSWLCRLLLTGNVGVPLFFAISGFILALPFIEQFHGETRKPVSLTRYLLRRVTRLEPPYLINLAVSVVILLVKGQALLTILPHLAASVVYMHNQIYAAHGHDHAAQIDRTLRLVRGQPVAD